MTNTNISYPKVAHDVVSSSDYNEMLDAIQEGTKTINTEALMLSLMVSDPVAPTEGQIWYNITEHQIKAFNGSIIVLLG